MTAPKLSLAMIVRDEERCIERALASAAPLVDELIVVDTGSTDRTVPLARGVGAHVCSFPWIDDFSAARNFALDQASADHILIIDADEWCVAEDRDVLRRWATRAAPGVGGVVRVLSNTESDGRRLTTEVTSIRVLPRSSRYYGRVHELPVGHTSEEFVSGLRVLHDGYEPAQTRRKRGRNERLLRTSLEAEPENLHLHFQLAKERQIAGDFAEASELYSYILTNVQSSLPWYAELGARTLYCLPRAGRLNEALRWAHEFMKDTQPKVEIIFAAGNLFLDTALERPAQWRELVALARASWLSCLDLGEPPGGSEVTLGCGSFWPRRTSLLWHKLRGIRPLLHPGSSRHGT